MVTFRALTFMVGGTRQPLLKLKRVQILGFKSFPDKTELTLPGEGIAAVVGPNGCGKSNILDGVTWVLGEQSAKSLRGGEMRDVIFAGTRDRRPLGMAEVSIALVDPGVYEGDTEPEPPAGSAEDWDEAALRAARADEAEQVIAASQPGQSFEAEEDGGVVLKLRRRKFHRAARRGEIIVTRRLFRTGESEYLLNGKLCRLADIRDIFMGTGLGPESYAIIGQERIGQLLSSKPHDRRAVIEEAAGITRYKTKKRLAELRLEQAKQNLARVQDIFEEVARQMVSLKRQAAKAERYGALRDEFQARQRVALGSRFQAMDTEAARLAAAVAELGTRIDAQSAEQAALAAALAEANTHRDALDAEAREQSRAAGEAAVELERARGAQTRNRDRIDELTARAKQDRVEQTELAARLQALDAERTEQQLLLTQTSGSAAQTRLEVDAKQKSAREASVAVGAAENRLESARREIFTLQSRFGEAGRAQAQAEEALAGLDREADRLRAEAEEARRERDTLSARRAACFQEAETSGRTLEQLEAELRQIREQTGAKRAAEAEARRRSDGLRSERAHLSGRRSSLENLLREHSYSTDTVKKLLRAGSLAGGWKPVGTLADFLEVGDQYEAVVDEFLRDELNFIVVKSWDAAGEGMRLLRAGPGAGVDGRATFLVHPEDAQARFSFAVDDGSAPAARAGVVGLKHCVRVLDGFGRSLEVILPKLRDGYVAPDAETARSLALENPDAFFLAPSGECFHNVTVTGGTPRAGGPLALKRELRQAEAQLAAVEEALAAADAEAAELSQALAELARRTETLGMTRRHAETASAHAAAALRQAEHELRRLESKVGGQTGEAERARAQRAAREAQITQKRAECARLTEARAAAEAELEALARAVAAARDSRDRAAAEAAESAAGLAALEERRRAAEAGLKRGGHMWSEGERRRAFLERQIAEAAEEASRRGGENQALGIREAELTEARDGAEARARDLSGQLRELRIQITRQEEDLSASRAGLEGAREERARRIAAAAVLAAELNHAGEQVLGDLGLAPEALRAEMESGALVPLAPEPLRAEEEACRELKRRMDALGPVNMMALEEYTEAETRHGFLSGQRKDLEDSIENIRAGVRELDEISRTKFDEAFARINEHFNAVFARLFGGGQASMRLTDEESGGDSGIDIIAQPPGKKLQNIFLLSGGEKALTALSLLMGIFMHQPAPFCVLDEVDAPLDETNVGRLAEMLRSMAEDTQFVLVTHSKRMMGAADMIYGVTMQEPGVSKLVSVRLGSKGRPAQRELALA